MLDRLVPEWHTLSADEVDAALIDEPDAIRIPLVEAAADFQRILDADPGSEVAPTSSANGNAPGREDPGNRRAVDGASFVLNESADVSAVWGTGDDVLWSSGEPLMIYGPDGVGKTSVGQQLLRARLGLTDKFLGLPVALAERRVLYIAADRPRQAARSLRRMVDEHDEHELDVLRERLAVWKGPLPFNLIEHPTDLAKFAQHHGAGVVFVDSLKDVALDLSKDEVGSRVSLAFQELVANDIELCVLHHPRKATDGNRKPNKLSDVYGSRWLTAVMGSVICIWGDAGDLVVELSHLKQPAGIVGPYIVIHDHVRGVSSVSEHTDLELILGNARDGLIVAEAARLMTKKADPNRNEIEKARRRLEALIGRGTAERRDDPDGLARYFVRRESA